MNDNVCHFVPFHKDYHSIHTIHFVLETKPQSSTAFRSESVYKLCYVSSGRGFLHTRGRIHPLATGDVFFTFPAEPFRIESGENFAYMYISFVGQRGNMLLEKLKVSPAGCVFEDVSQVGDFWKTGLACGSQVSDLMSESVLLYTFAVLGERVLVPQESTKTNDLVNRVKKYVDDNFTDPELSLARISRELSYNRKYISSTFKKQLGVGLTEYLNTVRIQQACTMMKQGFTGISDIALRCGYSDAQYFSKVFKSKLSLSPGGYIKSLQQKPGVSHKEDTPCASISIKQKS